MPSPSPRHLGLQKLHPLRGYACMAHILKGWFLQFTASFIQVYEGFLENLHIWWSDIWEAAQKSSICTLYKENLYKIIFQWYHTPDVLHRLFPAVDPICWRCGKQRGTLEHVFWYWPIIQSYWDRVHKLLQDETQQQLTLDPLNHLLGLPLTGLPKLTSKLIAHILVAARTRIPTR
uniref:Reverse transcriptase zinc-binding domain-containing protein n=1 Tax=Pyxicephalus adspersus TaxID=30357 RepID=A0AAV3AIK4_PYXAD|nr:TPA: hypothetical protein GDO54_010595 [Pyxicephalus adspersus]